MFEKPIICTTARWQRKAWTENGLMCLRTCASAQNLKMTEAVGEKERGGQITVWGRTKNKGVGQ